MTQTVNETLRDRRIAHGLAVIRYGAGLAAATLKTLDSANAAIRDALAKRLVGITERGFDTGPATTKRLNSMLSEISDINANIYEKAANDAFAQLADFGLSEAEWEAKNLTMSIGLDWEAKTPSPELLKAIVEEQPMEGRLLKDTFDGMTDARIQRITAAVRQGMIQGDGTDAIVRSIVGTKAQSFQDGVLQKSRNSMDAIVRTSVNHVANVASQSTWATNSDVVKRWQFVATLDSRTTITCASLDGKTFPIGQGPMPPRHVRCRSVTVAVTKTFRELGLDIDENGPAARATMDGQVAGTTSFTDFLNRKGDAVQDKILGPTRAKMFRAGKLDLDQFVRNDGTVLTLDQLKKLHPAAFD